MGREDLQAEPREEDEDRLMGWNEINNELNFGRVANLPREEQVQLEELVDVFRRHNSGNRLKTDITRVG